MCRNIGVLYNFDPPASSEEVHSAALQYVRKVQRHDQAVTGEPGGVRPRRAEIAHITEHLLADLVTGVPPPGSAPGSVAGSRHVPSPSGGSSKWKVGAGPQRSAQASFRNTGPGQRPLIPRAQTEG